MTSKRTSAVAAAITATLLGIAPAAWSQAEHPDPTTREMQNAPPPSQDADSADATAQDSGAMESSGQDAMETAQSDTAASANIDQRKIEQFADALIAVQAIQTKANEDLQAKTDPAAANEVKAKAETDMIAAVERSGLQVEEFNQISEVLASNVEFRSRVAAEVQKRRGS